MVKHVTIYTDGSCEGNPGLGGWGALLMYIDDRGNMHQKQICGKSNEITTNNRMELQAVIESLKMLKVSCIVKVFTDSDYVCKVTNRIQKRMRVKKNADLADELRIELQKHKYTFEWVKAHDGNEGNEIANKLAQQYKSSRERV